MKLLILNREGRERTSLEPLLAAARDLDLSAVVIDPSSPLPALAADERYLLYRIDYSQRAVEVQSELLSRYSVASFQRASQPVQRVAFALADIPTPTTRVVAPAQLGALQDLVDELGGFPLVVRRKVAGGNGVGVIKVDSLASLREVLTFIFARDESTGVAVQAFVKHRFIARLVVLGDEVIASVAAYVTGDDFRTNAGVPDSRPAEFPDEFQRVAVEATRANHLEFAGVDIIENQGRALVAEVNYPCYFTRTEGVSGVPIARRMLEYLIGKSKSAPVVAPAAPAPLPRLVLVNHPGRETASLALLKATAATAGLAVTTVDPSVPLPDLDTRASYLLHRLAPDARSTELELHTRFDCVSLAADYAVLRDSAYNRNEHYARHGIDYVPRVTLLKASLPALRETVERLGGLPLLMRITDGDSTDYLRAESLEAVLSLTDYAWSLGRHVSLQPFMQARRLGGLTVIGAEVVSSIELVGGDEQGYVFGRSELAVPRRFGEAVERAAIAAVSSHALEAGLVRVVLDDAGRPSIDDLYFPFYFPRYQNVTGACVVEKLLARLLQLHAERVRPA